jgi:murein DD-endopeptidase MepM/ murein hydrolase activator NlpD
MPFRSFPLLFLSLTMLTLPAVPTPAQNEALRVQPSNPRQGDALFVRLEGAGIEEPQVRWLNERFPLYRQGDVWRATVPVPPGAAPGGRTLAVTLTRGGQREWLERKVEVAKVPFPVQHLRMARSTARLYSSAGAKREDAAVGRAIRTVSDRRLWSGDWSLPAKGRTSTPFGVRRIRNGRAVGRHRGLDIAAKTGTPIRAPAAGRVVLAKTASEFKKYGGTVVLDHGQGVTTLYIHMSALGVAEGQAVDEGDLIGRVGSTGVATGPHLHWAAYVHGDAVEPQFFCRLSKRGVTP